jgi:hypothetical protein
VGPVLADFCIFWVQLEGLGEVWHAVLEPDLVELAGPTPLVGFLAVRIETDRLGEHLFCGLEVVQVELLLAQGESLLDRRWPVGLADLSR